MPERRLKEEYQEISDEYELALEEVGCSCHINAPCSVCIHEGHPENLANIPEAWEDDQYIG